VIEPLLKHPTVFKKDQQEVLCLYPEKSGFEKSADTWLCASISTGG